MNDWLNMGKIKTELLFRSSRDGDSISTLHNKIDGKECVVIIIKSTLNKVFGGYTSVSFDKSNASK